MIKIKPTRGLWRIVATFLAVSTALPLHASPAMEKLFYILKQKGSLTQDEYDLLVQTMKAEESAAKPAPVAAASTPALERRLTQDEQRIEKLQANYEAQREKIGKISDNTSPSTMSKEDLDALLSDKWYERIKVSGYMQTRFTGLLSDGDNPGVFVPNDPFVSDTNSIGIRRGRLKLSGDITNHLYIYMQADYFGGVGGSNALQARDYYADVSLDPAREFRMRFGLSKVPYGFVNLQSSQNRIPLERADALNSGVENERDFGAYFIWTPYEIRNRFKELVKSGLRGSGDYGVFNIGAYSGQGINARDANGDLHYITRLAYPFQFDNGQFFELGASAYSGRFVSAVAPVGGVNPSMDSRGVRDTRVAVNAVLYPQPFGLEAEWTWGEGPQLSDDFRTIQSRSLNGGYVQASYRHVFANGAELLPFVRYQYYDGARKFAVNAPKDNVEEVAVGMKFSPYKELELTLMYSHGSRTNTADTVGLYREVNADYLGLQAQINF